MRPLDQAKSVAASPSYEMLTYGQALVETSTEE